MLFKVFDEIENIDKKLSEHERMTNQELAEKGKELKSYVQKMREFIKAMKAQKIKTSQITSIRTSIVP